MDNQQGVVSRILKTENINWRSLKFLQDNDLKELDETEKHRLKASLLSNHFVDPFCVWEDQNGDLWCMDGRHRSLLLEELIQEGYQVPYLLPATFIRCEDKKEAAKLVLIYSSGYARVTQDGLHKFLTNYSLDFGDLKGEISLSDFSIEKFEQKFDLHGLEQLSEDDSEVTVVDEDIIVKPGDIFQLGPHRLICGSCLDESVTAILMQGQKARIIFTDPPYNLAANEFTGKGKVKHDDFAMAAGEMTHDEFVYFLEEIMRQSVAHTIDGSIHYICMDFRHGWHMCEAARKIYGSPEPKQVCVWNKSQGANGSFYRAKHELVYIFKNGQAKHLSHLDLMDRTRYNMWEYPTAASFANPDREMLKEHPTPKPVAMVADAILDTTNPDELVIDWFLGSGTTLIAADQVGRVCYGTEIEPKYVQSIINRYIKHCSKNNKECEFQHINGELSIDNFTSTSGY